MTCKYCDENGFCDKYSNDVTVWKCNGDSGCKDYEETEDGKDSNDRLVHRGSGVVEEREWMN